MSKEKNLIVVKNRDGKGKGPAKKMRREGMVPGIVYTRGNESQAVALDSTEWGKLAKHDVNLVTLKKENGDVTKALVKEVQMDYLKNIALHIDFQEIRMDEVITAKVAVHAGVGQHPVGVSQGGVLSQPLHEIEVKCLPGDLPESIEVDISELEIDGAIHVSGLVLPKGVTTTEDPEAVVFMVTQQQQEEEAVAEGAEAAEGGESAEQGEKEE